MSEKQFSSDDPVNDPIYERFMQRQLGEGMELARQSDLLRLHVPPLAPPHFVAEFLCKGLIREDAGEIKEASEFQVEIWFPPDYLRRADPFEMLRLFTPNVWHPNVSRELPLICTAHRQRHGPSGSSSVENLLSARYTIAAVSLTSLIKTSPRDSAAGVSGAGGRWESGAGSHAPRRRPSCSANRSPWGCTSGM